VANILADLLQTYYVEIPSTKLPTKTWLMVTAALKLPHHHDYFYSSSWASADSCMSKQFPAY